MIKPDKKEKKFTNVTYFSKDAAGRNDDFKRVISGDLELFLMVDGIGLLKVVKAFVPQNPE